MRIGLHRGSFIGGVIGKKKLRYDIWGGDVNIANAIEQNGIPGEICMSGSLKKFCDRHLGGCFAYEKVKDVPYEEGNVIRCYKTTPTWHWSRISGRS